jgi:3',5'-cyclic AMP phosphodiesterase CpdA
MLICQLTDLHIRPRGVAAYRVVETNAMAERAFRAVASLRARPDVVLLTGDVTECGLPEEYDLLAGLLRRHLPMPVYAIPGNHDRRGNFRQHLGHLPGVTADPEFVQYAIDDHPVRLVMLDTVVPGAGHGELCERRLSWLERALSAAPDRPTLIGMHHPPFRCGIEHMDRINLHTSEAFVEIIARHPQVKRIVCGHHHRAIVGQVAGVIVTVAPSVAHQVEFDLTPDAPSCFVLEPPAYQVHLWDATAGLSTHTAYVEAAPGPFPFLTDPDYPGKEAA